MEKKVGRGFIAAVQGDITTMKADAIVNDAITTLYMGTGVATAIRGAGGRDIERAAVRRGPLRIGAAVETFGGDLSSRYVIHAVTMEPDLRSNEKNVRMAVKSALRKAEELRLRTVAMPPLGAAGGTFPTAQAARVMVSEVAKHFRKPGTVQLVVFVSRRGDDQDAFAAELGKV